MAMLRTAIALPRMTPRLLVASRSFSTPASKDDVVIAPSGFPLGDYADPVEHETGLAKRELLARLVGDDSYDPKLYKRGPGTLDQPNEVPSVSEARIVGCICDENTNSIKWMWVVKGQPKRCQCGFFFKAVDADPNADMI